jgi:ABC-type Zn uptake system ZnuABC Zn-binding protein ZnuA
MKFEGNAFKYYVKLLYPFFISALVWTSSCTSPTPSTDKLRVVATTTIIGDVVGKVGGENIELTVLLPVDADPHSFSPAPKIIAEIETADIVFINGFGLEESLEDLITNIAEDKVISISEDIEPIEFNDLPVKEIEHNHGRVDPHVWMSPLNVQIWVNRTVEALSALDPIHRDIYLSNAEAYLSGLSALHDWILEQVAQIPQEDRVLITDHATFGYFAELYKFNIIGVLHPDGSTLAEPSAQDIAKLENAIEAYNIPVIFISTTSNQTLAERVSLDTGVKIIPLYSGSLSSIDGPAPTYVQMMRYDVNKIVSALKP